MRSPTLVQAFHRGVSKALQQSRNIMAGHSRGGGDCVPRPLIGGAGNSASSTRAAPCSGAFRCTGRMNRWRALPSPRKADGASIGRFYLLCSGFQRRALILKIKWRTVIIKMSGNPGLGRQ
jgi:hypothetical protein